MFLILSSSWLGWAPPHPDAVTSLPGFDGPLRSQLFSGYLRATADGQTFYSHYVLTESRSSPADDPLVLWQQGGPGSSGFGFGFLAEMGPYVLDADSLALNASAPRLFEREYSWDASANMLLFEHPPGTGFSYCVDAAEALIACTWDDQTQAEAFYATLLAFYTSFPQYRQHELRLIGESYAGLLLPYLAAEIYRHPTETPAKQLKGLAVGNGCPGTSGATPAKRGTCNGPYGSYDTQHVLELAYGHSALPRPLWQKLQAACGFPCKAATWSEGAHALALILTLTLTLTPTPILILILTPVALCSVRRSLLSRVRGSAPRGGRGHWALQRLQLLRQLWRLQPGPRYPRRPRRPRRPGAAAPLLAAACATPGHVGRATAEHGRAGVPVRHGPCRHGVGELGRSAPGAARSA
eukprot:scaffold63134_cov63-Phaeocystis_antarctica.AAC.2